MTDPGTSCPLAPASGDGSPADAPARSRVFLAARPGRVYVAHAIGPAVLVLAVVAVTTAALALGGALARHGAGAALDLILAAPAIVGRVGACRRRCW